MKSLSYVLCTLILALTFVSQSVLADKNESNERIFMGLLVKNYDNLVPVFLRSIERLDYDKSKMVVQINLFNNTPAVKEQVEKWIEEHSSEYEKISFVDSSEAPPTAYQKGSTEQHNVFRTIKNDFLDRTKEEQCSHCFIVESDAFLVPLTLKYLLSKNKPVITPQLRPTPEGGDAFRNYYTAADSKGYYRYSAVYGELADRKVTGTYKVPAISYVYLIKADVIDKLSFVDELNDWEYLAFVRNAQKNNVSLYMTNEREFGTLIHFTRTPTLAEEKRLTLAGADVAIDSSFLDILFNDLAENDPALKKHLANFNFDGYNIYRVENRDIFYVDEPWDWIKSHYIKKGLMWEKKISQDVFAKYAKPGTVALDIGGHMGTHTLNLSKLVGDKGTVHVFEPQAKMFTELVVNMALNDRHNIVFHRNALGNKEELIAMHSPCHTNEGMACVKTNDMEDPEFVGDTQMLRLDSLNLNNVSIIKIDIEGYEMEALEGAKETILRNKPAIVIEIHQGPDFNSKVEALNKLGYDVNLIEGHTYDYICTPFDKTEPQYALKKIISEVFPKPSVKAAAKK